MDHATAADILEEIMEMGYLEDDQIEAMEIAINLLREIEEE